MIPAHKQTDPSKAPGQIKNDITLGDYYERKEKAYTEKLTFAQWWDSNVPVKSNPYLVDSYIYWAYEGWKAAQENM